MAFKVYRSGSEAFEEFGDDNSFDIIEGGALRIIRGDGTRLYINSALWASIEETPGTSVYAE